MSIHQAKGLEFPVVLIPDLLALGGGSSHPPWLSGMLSLAVWPGRPKDEAHTALP